MIHLRTISARTDNSPLKHQQIVHVLKKDVTYERLQRSNRAPAEF